MEILVAPLQRGIYIHQTTVNSLYVRSVVYLGNTDILKIKKEYLLCVKKTKASIQNIATFITDRT